MDKTMRQLSQLVRIVGQQRHRPHGIDMIDIPPEYYRLYAKSLDPKSMGCHTLYDMCRQLADQSHGSLVIVDRQNGGFKSERIFFDQKAYERWIQDIQRSANLSALEALVNDRIPPDVPTQLGLRLATPREPKAALNTCQIQVFRSKVVHVDTPTRLYVQLKSTANTYQVLRRGLRCYEEIDEMDANYDYVLPKELAFAGYMCAVKNPLDWDNWHRAVITRVVNDTVTLFAVDFGNTIIETCGELRLLKGQFFAYPRQAIAIALTGIAPFNGNWTDDAIDFMKSYVGKYNCEYNFGCIFIDQLSDAFYSVIMCREVAVIVEEDSQMMNVYLHEKFIKRGLAQMIPCCWPQIEEYLLNIKNSKPFDTIREPLLAIKCEADFDAYESPNGDSQMVNTKCAPNSGNDRQLNSTEQMEECVEPKAPTGESLKIKKEIKNEVISTAEEIPNYSRFYFTNDVSHEMKLKSTNYMKYLSFPYVEGKYLSEFNTFPYYLRKYLTENETIVNIANKYLSERVVPTVPRKYMTSEDESLVDCNKYFTQPFDNNPNKYYNR